MSLAIFYGSFMQGQPGHGNLAGARLLESVETAPKYRLFSMGDYPAMIQAEEGVPIAAELYDVPEPVWKVILAAEPPGLRPATIELADGRVVEGMLAESEQAVSGGTEISEYGGWAAYVADVGEGR